MEAQTMAAVACDAEGKELEDVGLCDELQDAPDIFFCPISGELMNDPVILIDDYHTYDKANLLEWFEQNGQISPVTQQPLKTTQFIPNLAIKTQIDEYKQTKQQETKRKFHRSFVSLSPSSTDLANPIKLLLCGDCGVGKTSIKKYLEFHSSDTSLVKPTIGIEHSYVALKQTYNEQSIGKDAVVQITDICGMDRFRSLTRQYYHNIHGVVMVCSLDCPDSVKSLKMKWSDDLYEYGPDNIYGIVLVNKCDLLCSTPSKHDEVFANNLKLQYESVMRQAVSFANFVGFPIYNTSAVTGEYIHNAFLEITCRIMQDHLMWDAIQYGTHARSKTVVPLENLQESCSKSGCMWAIREMGEFAGKTYQDVKKKFNE